MNTINSLFQDEQERKAAEWLKANPSKTEEDAWFALNPEINDDPSWSPPWEIYIRRNPGYRACGINLGD